MSASPASPATPAAAPGRRERKKAATRQSLADAALRLFLERGYDNVTLKEIADEADVSTTTLLKHFPGKEALVFDEDADQEEALVSAVRDRPAGTSVPAALYAYISGGTWRKNADREGFAAFQHLIRATPPLADYAHRMWMRHESALAAAVAAAAGAPPTDPRSTALAHFALEARALAHRAEDPEEALRVAFELLEEGWGDR
ncbi:helix-turn-helix domain-containing protein [Streptomyces sp. NPDC047046]|uniref:TetR/AcrR family transcriptional regulator n=1 Tax=Streptomyces sp. NPDC047046 TaxID=3155378 RepID=UPI0033CF1AB1